MSDPVERCAIAMDAQILAGAPVALGDYHWVDAPADVLFVRVPYPPADIRPMHSLPDGRAVGWDEKARVAVLFAAPVGSAPPIRVSLRVAGGGVM